jgi:hypothetical protein
VESYRVNTPVSAHLAEHLGINALQPTVALRMITPIKRAIQIA